jgi:hypothetical protein
MTSIEREDDQMNQYFAIKNHSFAAACFIALALVASLDAPAIAAFLKRPAHYDAVRGSHARSVP